MRLIERLDQGLQPGHKLFLLSAPAGFGKTTLLVEWIRASRSAGAGQAGGAARFCWLTLDEDDNDLVRFFHYLVTALRTEEKGLGERCLSLLQAPQPPPPENLVTLLINDLALSSPQLPLTLVLDDYHLIGNQEIHRALIFLLNNAPAHFHLALATRADPRLPLAQMRVRGKMIEIREADLRFTEDDTAAFLDQTQGISLPPEQIAALSTRAEGWVAALQLVALALRGADSERQSAFINSFGGSHAHVVDYLMDEVWHQQPAAVREFLLETSVLEQMTAPLCAAVTAQDDGQQMLADLYRRNLFLVPLDNRRQWYRYHRLFADMLTARARQLGRARLNQLHRRAARWYEQEAMHHQAIHHALAGDDLETAIRLIGLAADAALRDGDLAAIQQWLDALPAARVRAHSQLALAQAWVAYLKGRIETAADYLAASQASWSESEQSGTAVSLLSLQAFLAILRGDIPAGTRLAQEALAHETDGDEGLRALILFNLIQVQAATGKIADAVGNAYRAIRLDLDNGNAFLAANIQHALLKLLLIQGKFGEVQRRGAEITERLVDRHGEPLPVAGPLFIVMGEAAFERGELLRAERALRAGIRLSQQMAAGVSVFSGKLQLAQVEFAQGEEEKALATLADLRQQSDLHQLQWMVAALEAEINLRLQQVAAALAWAEGATLPSLEAPLLQLEPLYLTYARCLMAGDRWAEADALLGKLARSAREEGRAGSLVPILVALALSSKAQGKQDGAEAALREALQIAAPAGRLQPFLQALPELLPLLQAVHAAAPTFVGELLSKTELPALTDRPSPLPDPLNERELQILRLIGARNTNPEIARELYLSVNTVKWYVKGIFQKLDVSSRRQAAARARELGLIP